MSFEQIVKNIDDLLCKDSGVDSELDDIGQTFGLCSYITWTN